jgi:hypothetical protein
MEGQSRFLLENRIDDSPRRKLLKGAILELLWSAGATFMFCNEAKVDLLYSERRSATIVRFIEDRVPGNG